MFILAIIDYIFLETFTKRKVTLMVALRLLEKLIRSDTSSKFLDNAYKSFRKPLIKLMDYLNNIELETKNINNISMWIEDIFTKSYDLKKVIQVNNYQIYDFKLFVQKNVNHHLFLFENNDSVNKKVYNSIFLFSRIAYFFERNFRPIQKTYNFKRMYNNFYGSSLFSRFKESKSYNIDGRESVAAKIKVVVNDKIATIDV